MFQDIAEDDSKSNDVAYCLRNR